MILCVEDDSDFREALAEFLSLHGCVVECAANGREALRFLHDCKSPPRLILLDLSMPRLNGWAFLMERRKDPAIAAVPVVVISGLGDDTPERVKRAGATVFVGKPVDPQTLLALVEHFSALK